MSCRTTASGSAATTIARVNSGLTDVQTLSTYHSLRAEAPTTATAPTDEQWQEHLQHEVNAVRDSPYHTVARRVSLLLRLNRATRETPPDAATFYALRNINMRCQNAQRNLDDTYDDLANQLGVSPEEIRERAARYADQGLATGTGARRNTQSRNSPARARFRTSGLPQDRGTIAAIERLRQETLTFNQERMANPEELGPRRIIMQQSSASGLTHIGYDNGRLELQLTDGTTQAYQNVPQDYFTRVHLRGTVAANIMLQGRPAYQYANEEEADADGHAQRCPACGQWSGTTHTCPPGTTSPTAPRRVTYATAPLVGTETGTNVCLTAPNTSRIRVASNMGPIVVPISGECEDSNYGTYSTAGEVIVESDGDDGWTVTNSSLRCNCDEYGEEGRCEHTENTITALAQRVNPEPATRNAPAPALTETEQATANALEISRAALAVDLERGWNLSEEHTAASKLRFVAADDGTHYANDMAAFEDDYNNALARKTAGETVVEYMTGEAGTVTGGLGSRESGRSFGIELEIDFDQSTNSYDALQAIGRELYAAGLTRQDYQEDYHAAAHRGYTEDHQGGWSFEEDETVAGEIVSPVMFDEPETWENIEKVCEIVKRHGGTASTRTGSHVHVGTGTYDHNTANHTELVRTINAYEDVMYRISQNPAASEHRSTYWCGPNRDVPPQGYASLESTGGWPNTYVAGARDAHHSHNIGLNLQSVYGQTSDHAELRHWDGTLDPGVIQTQIKTSLAIVDAAQRNASQPGALPKEPLGSHLRRGDSTLEIESATFRHFADTLYSRREDKAQLASLFAVTKWANPDNNQDPDEDDEDGYYDEDDENNPWS